MGNSLDTGSRRSVGAARRVYLDYNATAPLRPEAAEAVLAALRLGGNASSVHAEGRAARSLIEHARDAVAALVGGASRRVVFTSGGTEALNLALVPGIRTAGDARPVTRLLVSAVEHSAVREGHRFPPESVATIPVLPSGIVDLAALQEGIDCHPDERVLVALMAANNETGVVQPIAEAARLVHARGGLLLVDAVQAAGKIPLSLAESCADMLALSGHKLGAPSGVGALVLGSDIVVPPLVRGGGQERGQRSGTENLSGIAGFGAAAAAARRDLPAYEGLAQLRDGLEARMRALRPQIVIFGDRAPRLPNTLCFALPGSAAEAVLIGFDLGGVAASSGSACSSGKVKASHVLDSMGVAPDVMRCAIRISLGSATTPWEIDRAFEVWRECVERSARRAA